MRFAQLILLLKHLVRGEPVVLACDALRQALHDATAHDLRV